jgi:hypothetical protein
VWANLRDAEVVCFDVKFPVSNPTEIEIPAEALPAVFRALRRGLEYGSKLLADIDARYWQTASFVPDDDAGERYVDEPSVYLHWVASLFERFALEYPAAARIEAMQWPVEDHFFFSKLKIHLWARCDLFSNDDVADGLDNFTAEGFWDSRYRRELLHLIRVRWNNFPESARLRLEHRFFEGPPRWESEGDGDYLKRTADTKTIVLGWMERNNLDVSADVKKILASHRGETKGWNARWEETADQSIDGRSGWVHTEADPSDIVDAPVSRLADLAIEATGRRKDFTHFKPFQGVIEQRPLRGVAALSFAARQGKYDAELWRTAISSWPEITDERLRWIFAQRLANLPNHQIANLRYDIPSWFRSNLPDLGSRSMDCALKLWDKILEKYAALDAAVTQSAIGDVSIGGESLGLSRRTYEHSINSPIGRMTETLFELLDKLKPDKVSKIPDDFKNRLDYLLNFPGEGGDHAACEIALRLRYLWYLDPTWVKQRLLSLFEPLADKAEPAWNGYLHDNHLVPPDLFALIKRSFLDIYEHASQWHWRDQATARLSQFLVMACLWNQREGNYVSFEEARYALQSLNDDGRARAAWMLATVLKKLKCWRVFGKPFLEKAWPQEVRFRTSETSRILAMIAEDSRDNFPDVVRTISHLLVPVDHADILIHRIKGTKSPLATKYPESMLQLLDKVMPNNPRTAPYGLAATLEDIAISAPELRQDTRWQRLAAIARG